MKHLLTFILAFTVLSGYGQYHIRVECFGHDNDPDYQYYYIRFTTNNWKTSTPLMESFDISDETTPFDVTIQEKLFTSYRTAKQDAIEFAKRFKTLNDCINWNNYQLQRYRQLLAYRKSHPIKRQIEKAAKKNCCTLTQIY